MANGKGGSSNRKGEVRSPLVGCLKFLLLQQPDSLCYPCVTGLSNLNGAHDKVI